MDEFGAPTLGTGRDGTVAHGHLVDAKLDVLREFVLGGLGGACLEVDDVNTAFAVDLDAPTDEMSDDAPFQLRCDPGTAAARLKRLADLGFDDAIFVPRAHTEASLGALRALLP